MQLANPNSSTDGSLNALLLPGAVPNANSPGLTVEGRAAFPQFESFMPDIVAELASPSADDPTIVAESLPGGASGAGLDLASISCPLALGRWLVATEVPPVLVGEIESKKNPTAVGSRSETETPKKTTKSPSELTARLAKGKSDGEKAAVGAAAGVPIDGLALVAYFPVADVPPADLELVETTNKQTPESSDAVVSDRDSLLPSEAGGGLFRKMPEVARSGGESDKSGAPAARVGPAEFREVSREEPTGAASLKTPPAEFSTRFVTEPADTSKAQEPGPSDRAAGSRPTLTAVETQTMPKALSKIFDRSTKLDVSKSELPLLRPTERADTLLPDRKPSDTALPVDSDASIAGGPLESYASGPKQQTWAEFAAKPIPRDIDSNDEENDGPKNFVSSDREILTRQRAALGITVAKPSLSMSSRFSSLLPDAPANDRSASASMMTVGFGETAEATRTEPLELPRVSAAHEAVQVVMNAAEQISLRDQKSVRLQFSVGDARLDVRVELHANEVRTQFRTDSVELRQALSHEWQSVAAEVGNGDRGLRIAPAVFSSSSNDQSSFNAFAGDASTRQREQRASQQESGRSSRVVAPVNGGRGLVDAVATSPRSLRSAPPTSQHLHILA